MIFELLAAVTLGMAVSSGRKPSSTSLSMSLGLDPGTHEPPPPPVDPAQLALPFPEKKAPPSLWETLDALQPVYALVIADGYLIAASRDRDRMVDRLENIQDYDSEVTEAEVWRALMPIDAADRLVENNDFRDGYDAAHSISTFGREVTTVAEWTIYDEEDYDLWPDEFLKNHRKNILERGDFAEKTLHPGTLVYHSTDQDLFEEDEGPLWNLDFFEVVLFRDKAIETLTDPSYRPRPDRRRLLTYKVIDPIRYRYIAPGQVDWFERLFSIDLSDAEEASSRILRLDQDDGVEIDDVGTDDKILFATTGSLDEMLELISVEPLEDPT